MTNKRLRWRRYSETTEHRMLYEAGSEITVCLIEL